MAPEPDYVASLAEVQAMIENDSAYRQFVEHRQKIADVRRDLDALERAKLQLDLDERNAHASMTGGQLATTLAKIEADRAANMQQQTDIKTGLPLIQKEAARYRDGAARRIRANAETVRLRDQKPVRTRQEIEEELAQVASPLLDELALSILDRRSPDPSELQRRALEDFLQPEVDWRPSAK